MSLKAPRGTNDILPPLSLKWQYVEEKIRELLRVYNYEEIRTPIFEYTELFQRGIGETTDIVEKEMYTFTDKGGRSITLRPEGTAPVVRSFLENKLYGEAQPRKFFYIGPMFRYERPQAGRFRQFHQLGVEALGSNDPALDAEVILLGLNILEKLGLTDLETYINSIGCPKCRADYLEVLKGYLQEHREELCRDCQTRLERNPLRVLDCKNESCSRVVLEAPLIIDYLCDECDEHFNQVKDYLDYLEVKYQVDPTLVRGLDYYTNTAFEIKYRGLGAQDTIFGGGRYNGLAEEIGKKDIPGIGFAIGLERLMITLEEQGIELPVEKGIDLYITTIGDRAKRAAFKYIYHLRKAGLKTEMDYLDRSVRSQMKAADRMNATYTIILGEDELDKGVATIRNMKSGEEVEIKLDKLVEHMSM
ncbi:MAG: histidyl-tRNA synthetase [Halanaerobiales bacterium]|nr:histidyl-tRNA synthetase [Halanaerobiales bacterium]